ARGEHQDRRVRLRAHLPADLETVDVGKHQVEHESVERVAPVQRQAAPAVCRVGHAEARLAEIVAHHRGEARVVLDQQDAFGHALLSAMPAMPAAELGDAVDQGAALLGVEHQDRKSTRLNSSHLVISYAVFCLKKKKEDSYSWRN